MGFASGGSNIPVRHFFVYLSFVARSEFSAENPARTQSPDPLAVILMRTIPKIDIKNSNTDFLLHADNIIAKFPNSDFSNFNLKWIEIIQRVENVNVLIKDLFEEFDFLRNELFEDKIKESIIKTPYYYRQKFLTEQIFYWIRKTIDELISLIYVLEYIKKESEYPKKIEIESIGKLLYSKNFLPDLKNKNQNVLTIINDISNTYKHSFLNSETLNHIGEFDPLVFSYGFKNNDLNKKMIFTQYKIEDIITHLNILVEDLIDHIKTI